MSPGPLRLLVTPRDDNPYQDLLYHELAGSGVDARYPDGPSRSQSVNLLLAPAVLAWYRVRGFKILHIHWVYKFALPWARGARSARLAMEVWFAMYLHLAHLLGFRIVWTAHDIVPHEPVFFDDARAHAHLARRSDIVVALSKRTADQLVAIGARDVRVVPHPSYARPHSTATDRRAGRALLCADQQTVVVLWFGKVARYKGVDLLLDAAAGLPEWSPVRIVVAGECVDPSYRDELLAGARRVEARVVLRLERLSDEEVGTYLVAADLAAFPFREITNSGSVLTALSFGLPVILPRLESLRDIPEQCLISYDAEVDDLAEVLERAGGLSAEQRRAMGDVARDYAGTMDGPGVARAMREIYEELVARS